MELLLVSVIGYLIGAIPFAYIIGKAYYNTDVREKGSGNLGGSNTGRVLGGKAGVAVMALDLLKVTLSVFLASRIGNHSWSLAIGAISAGIGHCYPIYVHFRGGKAVAALYGYLFALWIISGYSPFVFFLPLCVFLLTLAAFKIVSLASIVSSAAALIYICAVDNHISAVCAVAAFVVLIVLRHNSNIRRLIVGNERKIRWFK